MDKALISVSGTVGLGKVTSVQDDVIVTENGKIYTMIRDMRRICELQRRYGTGNVSYSPNPLLALEPGSKIERNPIFLVVYGGTNTSANVNKLTSHMEKRYTSVTKIAESRLRVGDAVTMFRSVSYVLFYRVVTPGLFYILFASGVPFFLVDCSLGSFIHILNESGLEKTVVGDNSYLELKNTFREAYINRQIASNMALETTDRLRRIMSWVAVCVGFRDLHYSDLNVVRTPYDYHGIKIGVAISVSDYKNTFVKDLASEIFNYSVVGGVHFELETVNAMSCGGVYLHPWFGCIEVIDNNTVEECCNRREFLASIPMCLGLIVYDKNVMHHLQTVLGGMGFNLPIITILPPIIPSNTPSFNYEKWLSQPTMVNFGKNVIIVDLNLSSQSQTQNFILRKSSASSNQSSSEDETQTEFQITAYGFPGDFPNSSYRKPKTCQKNGSHRERRTEESINDSLFTEMTESHKYRLSKSRNVSGLPKNIGIFSKNTDTRNVSGLPKNIGNFSKNTGNFSRGFGQIDDTEQDDTEFGTTEMTERTSKSDEESYDERSYLESEFTYRYSSKTESDPSSDSSIEFSDEDTFQYKGDGDSIDLSSHINRLVVITECNNKVIDLLSGCIARKIPVVVTKNQLSVLLFGQDYPLFVTDAALMKVSSMITPKLVLSAHLYMANLPNLGTIITVRDFLQHISVSKIGQMIRHITC